MDLRSPLWPALGVVLLLAGCANRAEIADRTALQFDEAMFGGPFDSDRPQEGRLIKWVTPIHAHLSGVELDKHGPAIGSMLRKAAAVAGVPLRIDPAQTGNTNFRVVLIPREGISVRNDFARCAADVKERDGVIRSATVIITTAHAGGEAECTAHEIMHALGFLYHSGNLRSVLSPAHQEADFTHWDKLTLRMLYSSKLAPGMRRDAVKPLLRPMVQAMEGTSG